MRKRINFKMVKRHAERFVFINWLSAPLVVVNVRGADPDILNSGVGFNVVDADLEAAFDLKGHFFIPGAFLSLLGLFGAFFE